MKGPFRLTPKVVLACAVAALATPPVFAPADPPSQQCHLQEIDPDERNVTARPVADRFGTFTQGNDLVSFDSLLRSRPDGPPIRDRRAAEAVHSRVVEALARYGVRPEHVKLIHTESDNSYRLIVALTDVPNRKLRQHLAYHAERFNLRPLFSKLEQLNAAARESFFDLPPVVGAELVNRLTENDFLVVNRWFELAPTGPDHSIRTLIGCP